MTTALTPRDLAAARAALERFRAAGRVTMRTDPAAKSVSLTTIWRRKKRAQAAEKARTP
jgi:hypothetical protein